MTAQPDTTCAYLERIDHVAAWKGADMRRDDIAIDLTRAHCAALDKALRRCCNAGLAISDVDCKAFPLPELHELIGEVRRELSDGRGIVLLRGLEVARYSLEELELMYWGLGTHLGTGLSQSVMGDRIGHVTDVSGKDPNERAYRNSLEIPPHTDSADIVGMLSIRAAHSGGLSTYTSALAIHNTILDTRPDLLEPLYRGYRVHCFGEQAPGAPPVTTYRVPVLSEQSGLVSACIVPEYIDMAEVALGEPMPAHEREALDLFMHCTAREELRFDIMLEPGDISLINNHVVLHSRTAFDDHEDPGQRRHLLRLWLEAHERRPLHERFNGGEALGVAPQAEREATYFHGAEAKIANRGRYGET